jgi:demethylmacrocin O-methyltransferase
LWRDRLGPIVGDRGLRRLGRVRRSVLAAGGLASLPRTATVYGTDKWNGHSYAEHYQRHLSHLRLRSFVLMEIGVGGYGNDGLGAESLRMWKQFFPRAQVVGLDLVDKRHKEEPRIRIFQGDQSDPDLLRRIVAEVGRPTVVVDDGSHVPAHVRASFATLFPLLTSDGVYCIEDLQTSYWPAWGGSRDRSDPSTSMALVKDLIDGLNHVEYLDEEYRPSYTDEHVVAVHAYHNLAIVQKGHNREGTNKHVAADPSG